MKWWLGWLILEVKKLVREGAGKSWGNLSRRVWSCWLLIPDGLRVWCDELRLYLGQLYQPPLRRPASAELFQSCGFPMSSANRWKTSPWKGHESAMGPLYKLRIAFRCWCCWKGTASPTSSCRAPPDFSTHMQVLQIRSLWTVLMLSWRLVQSPKSSRSFLTLSLWLASATGSRGALRVVAHQVFGFLVLGLSFRAPHRRVWPASR